ncbi:class I SAM-dependent methyltransferase [Pullulanibacillus sp. KACC 23026]|uniref:class I SAM-dependent methyltransferase n=1 Tax=Pullulanibacillus sp. KACC 23026 TaxID=3028315 RepID=UPI0023AF62B0|nr:class I SAM-dependent methyltransferase [Pullulanibacillus sp. KACC 23026]WEG11279.1 class I SAM-dependent methyltransferase [Pullulanibacillus sp. KACC 23026]
MSKWFPRLYDTLMSPLEKKVSFKNKRKHLIERASGKVLEIGAGTGINFSSYTHDTSLVVATDPNPEMVKKAQEKAKIALVPLEIQIARAEELPFPDHSFDTVVATLVFCTIPHPESALKDIYRVLKPGGKLLLFEHVQMKQSLLKASQQLLTPIWKPLCDGCHLNRDTLGLIEASPLFHVKHVDSIYSGLFLAIEAEKHSQT